MLDLKRSCQFFFELLIHINALSRMEINIYSKCDRICFFSWIHTYIYTSFKKLLFNWTKNTIYIYIYILLLADSSRRQPKCFLFLTSITLRFRERHNWLLPLLFIRTLQCWVLSKEPSRTIFCTTRLGIEHWSPGLMVKLLKPITLFKFVYLFFSRIIGY